MIRETTTEAPLDAALKRLDQALAELEQRLSQRALAAATSDPASDADHARLAAELEQSKARERELEAAGVQASEALGRAISEIRAALGETDELATEET
jgi:hypothetical protein